MNRTQRTDISSFDNTSHLEPAPTVSVHRPTAGFMHPDQVIGDPQLTQAEKREILASWASDARVVPDAAALRQLDNGAVVRVGDVLRALKSLDENENLGQKVSGNSRPFASLCIRLPTRLKSALLRSRSDDDDDDDPPPSCPAMIVRPLGGPLPNSGAAVLGLALAA